MKRRTFLTTTIAGILGTVPSIALAGKILEPGPDWIIDHETGNIIYNGPRDKSYSVVEFYRFLAQEYDKPKHLPDRFPLMRQTDQLVVVQDGYQITPEGMKHLRDGSIEQNGEHWFSVWSIGDI